MNKKQSWMYVSIGSIILSVISLLLPVLSYQNSKTGTTTHYNIFKLLSNSDLIQNVFKEYQGEFLRSVSYGAISVWVIILSLIGLIAIILSFVGIKSMAKQYESARPFQLTICGLVGTAIPSIVLLILYIFSKNQYAGTMRLGTYIVVTPIAMVLACFAVTNKYRMSKEEAAIEKEARRYIRPAGDLPVRKYGGSQYYGKQY